MVELSTKQDWDSLLDSVDTVLLDCDGQLMNTNRFHDVQILSFFLHPTGVLWTGLDTIVPGAQDVVKCLRQKVPYHPQPSYCARPPMT